MAVWIISTLRVHHRNSMKGALKMSFRRNGIKAFGLVFIAALALTAVMASAAQALPEPRWKVNGVFLTQAETKNLTSKNAVAPRLSVPGLGLTLVCQSSTAAGNIQGSEAEKPGKGEVTTGVTYEGCAVEGAPACVVFSPGQEAGTIKTVALKTTNVWLNENHEGPGAGAAGVLFQPKEGETFVSIMIEECAAETAEPEKVTGSVIGRALPVETEVEVGKLQFPEAPVTKYWVGNPAKEGKRTAGTIPVGLKFGGQAAVYSGEEEVTITGVKAGIFPG
jgi:hypothetical protein